MNPAPGQSAIEVFVFQAGRFLGSRCFAQRTVVIGSSPQSTLRLRDPSIGARHAVLRLEGNSLVLASDSNEQILVNGEPISVRQVHSFDEIRIGPFRLKFTLLGGDEQDAGFGAEPQTSTDVAPDPTREQRVAPTPHASAQGRHGADERDPTFQQHDRAGETGRSGSLPWLEAEGRDERSGQDFDEDAPTRMAPRPTRPPSEQARTNAAFDAGSQLNDEAAVPRGPTAPPVDRTAPFQSIMEPPGEPKRGRIAYEDTAAQPSAKLPPDDPYAAPEGARDSAEFEAKGHSGLGDSGLGDSGLGDSGLGHPNAEHPFPSADDAAGQSDWDEDDEDDEPFVEPFSLLENVVRERFKTPARTEPYAVVETIRYRHGEIIDLSQADAGKTVKTFPDGFKLVEVTGDGTARLRFRPDFSGSVVRGGKARPLKRLVRPELLISQRKKIYAVDLREGDYAQIVRDEGGYLVRFVRPPQVPHAKFTFGSWGLDLPKLQIFAGSAAFHFLILVMLGFVAPEADLYMEPEAERFAKVTMKDLKLEKPLEEPPEPEKPPEPPPEADKPTEKPKTRKRTKSPATPQQRAKVQKKQVSKVLTALQNIKPAGAPGRSNLKSLVTNIKAVRAPTGTGSSFKVSGVIGKLPGNAVRLAGGGRGGAQTKVGSQLLAGGKIGNIAAAAGTGTRVRGRARKAPTRKIRATGGVLSREAIQRVVSRHMAKIQACYERQLLVKRNLAGKIVFDWVISLNGSVGSARQVSSSLGSVAVSTCILREMRTWRFPHPVGGSVDVRYPFVFRVQGF